MLLGQEVHYYMVYIAYFTELNLQICDYAQKRCICRENCKYAFDENFYGHFCPRRKAANFCHPGLDQFLDPLTVIIIHFKQLTHPYAINDELCTGSLLNLN